MSIRCITPDQKGHRLNPTPVNIKGPVPAYGHHRYTAVDFGLWVE